MDINGAVVDGIPLLLVIAGLVEFAKKLGLKGNGCVALSMGLGLLFGVAFWVYENGAPVAFGGWLSLVVYGLALGLTTSGLYDIVQGLKA